MNSKQELALYKLCLLNDVALQYGKLTLCDLSHYNVKLRKYKYQIYCDDRRLRPSNLSPKEDWYCYTKMYTQDELDKAIEKFIELKQKIGPRAR